MELVLLYFLGKIPSRMVLSKKGPANWWDFPVFFRIFTRMFVGFCGKSQDFSRNFRLFDLADIEKIIFGQFLKYFTVVRKKKKAAALAKLEDGDEDL